MKTYDFIFSLGAACSCSQSLRLAGLQFASYPLDWLYGGTLTARVEGLTGGLSGWFDAAKLVKHDIAWHLEHEPYRNVETGIVFKHDFAWNTPLAEMVADVREKYGRRWARLDARMSAAQRVLAVWITTPTTQPPSDEELAACRAKLATRWPQASIDLLALVCERGRDFRDRAVRDLGGVTVVAYDYFDGRAEFIDNEKMAAFLASVCAAVDYRSDDERRAWPAKRRVLRYAQYNATNAWTYFVNRAHVRLYRHLRRWIARKGLDKLG